MSKLPWTACFPCLSVSPHETVHRLLGEGGAVGTTLKNIDRLTLIVTSYITIRRPSHVFECLH